LLRPAAVVLDLDLSQQAAWNAAETLLLEQHCPPVMLVTARTERSEVRTAIRVGSIVDKAADPLRLLQLVYDTMTLTRAGLSERKASQRELLRTLRARWRAVPLSSTRRFWRSSE
jgi:DNA-binding response OmpR family regulator